MSKYLRFGDHHTASAIRGVVNRLHDSRLTMQAHPVVKMDLLAGLIEERQRRITR